jgi:hypothetical protein
MHIEVNRIKSDDDATLSTVSIDGKFECFGLEDEYREDKVPGETRIPAGVYDVVIRDVGGFHGRYSRKFPAFHKGMLQVKDVPGFEYILIHIGNTDENTAGCLLVGKGAMVGEEITIQNSTGAYKELYQKVIAEAQQGQLTIEYKDNDRL